MWFARILTIKELYGLNDTELKKVFLGEPN
jgi:hypothetical protein